MANERIILNFLEFTPYKAQRMVEDARAFATMKPDGKPGPYGGAVWKHAVCGIEPVLLVHTYWTKTRTVVATELPEKP